jgi:hypothetical protein
MVNYYQSLVKKFNTRKQKPRYKAKRERRFFLTEAYIDGELALYKPAYIPYRVFTDKVKWVKPEKIEPIIEAPIIEKPVKLTWFDKLIMWIRKIFKNARNKS